MLYFIEIGKKNWNNKISVKWRDIYDLFWYLSTGIKANIDCISWIKTNLELKEKLIEIISKVNFKEVIFDIENFIEDRSILAFIENNWKDYVLEKIREI